MSRTTDFKNLFKNPIVAHLQVCTPYSSIAHFQPNYCTLSNKFIRFDRIQSKYFNLC